MKILSLISLTLFSTNAFSCGGLGTTADHIIIIVLLNLISFLIIMRFFFVKITKKKLSKKLKILSKLSLIVIIFSTAYLTINHLEIIDTLFSKCSGPLEEFD
jgi:hypothetical protein